MKNSIVYKYLISNTLNNPSYYWFLFLRIIFYISSSFIPIIIGFLINELTYKPINLDKIYFYIGIYVFLLIIFRVIIELYSAKAIWILAIKMFTQTIYPKYFGLIRNANSKFWQKNGKGSIIKIVDDGTKAIYSLIASFAHLYTWNFFNVVGAYLAVLFLDVKYSVIFMLSGVLHVLNIYFLTKLEKKAIVNTRVYFEKGIKILSEYINNFSNVFYLNLFDKVEENNSKNLKNYFEKYKKREDLSILKWLNNVAISSVTEILIVALAIYDIYNGKMEAGYISTLLLLSNQARSGIASLIEAFKTTLEQYVMIERLDQTLGQLQINQINLPKITEFDTLEFKNLTLTGRNNLESLTNISLQIQKGQKIAIVGPSGSGKSSLIDLILKSETEFKGEIILNKMNYNDISENQITSIFSIVPQDVQLFEDTVKNNIIMSNDKNPISQSHFTHLLDICNLNKFVANLPDKENTIIYEKSSNISGGEKQRIGIARAINQINPVLILDEATTALDPINEKQIIKNLIEEYKEKTLIYITHKYGVLNYFDLIVVLHEGKIVELGSFPDLISKGGLFKDLYESH
jgi:ATP-binding cassette, subfamily B, bacterial